MQRATFIFACVSQWPWGSPAVFSRRLTAAVQPGASRLCVLVRDVKGAFLLETVIATMVFALVGVAVLAGLTSAFTSGTKTEEQSVAENLARNQVEYVFSQPYREPQETPYLTMAGIPANYSLTTTVDFQDPADPDPEVETVTVTASHFGQEVLTLSTLRGRADGLQLRYSFSDDRSDSARLHGATISGPAVYVFLDDPELQVDTQTEFFLDGAFERTENHIHWDFKGTAGSNPSDPANPWDTTTDPAANNGPHTIKAKTSLFDGNTVNVTADFTISN